MIEAPVEYNMLAPTISRFHFQQIQQEYLYFFLHEANMYIIRISMAFVLGHISVVSPFVIRGAAKFSPVFERIAPLQRGVSCLLADINSSADAEDDSVPDEIDSQDNSCRSSEMSDRFKYQVNALMGAFDPQSGSDDEYQNGNILNGKVESSIRS